MNRRSLLAFNPELQRQVWLELTLTRLLVMPLVIALVAGLTEIAEGIDKVGVFAGPFVGLILIVWGTRLAAESISDELTERTWDVQRLSAANPWAIAFGKLIGGTSYAWYGALIGIAVDFYANPDRALEREPSLVVAGAVSQALALFLVLALHRLGRRSRAATAFAQIIAILTGLGIMQMSSWMILASFTPAAHPLPKAALDVVWYGMTFPANGLRLALTAISGVWLFAGSAINIRREMGERGDPVAWLAYTLYLCAITGGYLQSNWSLEVAIPQDVAVIAAIMTYLALLVTPLDVITIKRIQMAARSGPWWRLWQELPAWVPTALLALAGAAALIVLSVFYSIAPGVAGYSPLGSAVTFGYTGNFVRDILIVCAVRLGFERRTDLALAVIFALLYLFLPSILTSLHLPDWREVFLPNRDPVLQGVIGPWVLAAIALIFLLWAVRRRRTKQ